ncbi:hypothetical protein [Simkania sp.]|uniref:hypothetical protein n=1 Tax=Simkania sp. TaxID=34094 RepID=UPI003B51B5BD
MANHVRASSRPQSTLQLASMLQEASKNKQAALTCIQKAANFTLWNTMYTSEICTTMLELFEIYVLEGVEAQKTAYEDQCELLESPDEAPHFEQKPIEECLQFFIHKKLNEIKDYLPVFFAAQQSKIKDEKKHRYELWLKGRPEMQWLDQMQQELESKIKSTQTEFGLSSKAKEKLSNQEEDSPLSPRKALVNERPPSEELSLCIDSSLIFSTAFKGVFNELQTTVKQFQSQISELDPSRNEMYAAFLKQHYPQDVTDPIVNWACVVEKANAVAHTCFQFFPQAICDYKAFLRLVDLKTLQDDSDSPRVELFEPSSTVLKENLHGLRRHCELLADSVLNSKVFLENVQASAQEAAALSDLQISQIQTYLGQSQTWEGLRTWAELNEQQREKILDQIDDLMEVDPIRGYGGIHAALFYGVDPISSALIKKRVDLSQKTHHKFLHLPLRPDAIACLDLCAAMGNATMLNLIFEQLKLTHDQLENTLNYVVNPTLLLDIHHHEYDTHKERLIERWREGAFDCVDLLVRSEAKWESAFFINLQILCSQGDKENALEESLLKVRIGIHNLLFARMMRCENSVLLKQSQDIISKIKIKDLPETLRSLFQQLQQTLEQQNIQSQKPKPQQPSIPKLSLMKVPEKDKIPSSS